MNRGIQKTFILLILFSISVFAQLPDRMNIVLILVDDLGWSDLTCYGSDLHETPNVDRLAEQGYISLMPMQPHLCVHPPGQH